MPRVAVLDYKVGNIFSMMSALKRTGLEVELTSDPARIMAADGLVLPGVGNYGVASRMLEPYRGALTEALESGKPMLGSCLGMQLLFESSEEAEGAGLGFIKGCVKRFGDGVKVPHMGWNQVAPTKPCLLLEGVEDEYFYFVHSFYPDPADPKDAVATTEYDGRFVSVVSRGCLYGTQFHPEKSGASGAALLRNYAGLLKR
jgi:glutamine amidotransferase